MRNPNKIDTLNTTPFLDLREWWKQVSKKNVEHIINSKDMWKYRWFNEDKTIITTIKEWKITNYNVNETDIIFKKRTEITKMVTQKTWPELLEDLFLNPICEVKSALEAKNRARYSDNKKFWLQKDNTVTIIDYSYWTPPKIKRHQLDKYNLKKETVKI